MKYTKAKIGEATIEIRRVTRETKELLDAAVENENALKEYEAVARRLIENVETEDTEERPVLKVKTVEL